MTTDVPDTAVPVNQEPFHKLVLKNDYVEALHVTIPPARSTRWHTHSHDGVAVRLTDATVSTRSGRATSTGSTTG